VGVVRGAAAPPAAAAGRPRAPGGAALGGVRCPLSPNRGRGGEAGTAGRFVEERAARERGSGEGHGSSAAGGGRRRPPGQRARPHPGGAARRGAGGGGRDPGPPRRPPPPPPPPPGPPAPPPPAARPRAFAAPRPLLAQLDAAAAAAPPSPHHAVASEVLRRGVPALVEKLLATTLAEADELVALARRHGTLLQVGHIER